MKSISFKNFRRFADFPEFKFGDITILVGGNNAGKSTLVKALLLLVDNLKSVNVSKDFNSARLFSEMLPFRFDANGLHELKIGTYLRAITHGNEKERTSFSFTINDFDISFELESVTKGTENSRKEELNTPFARMSKISVFDKFEQIIYTNDYDKATMSISFLPMDGDDTEELEILRLGVKSMRQQLKNELDPLERNDIKQEIAKYSKIIKLQESQLRPKRKAQKFEFVTSDARNLLNGTETNSAISQFIENFFLMFNALPDEVSKDKSFKKYVTAHSAAIKRSAARLDDYISNLNFAYIKAHSISQRSQYLIDDRNDDMAQAIHTLAKCNIHPGSKTDRFIKNWMEEFKIGKSYSFATIDGESYTFKIVTIDGNKENLSDMGMGTNQLMMLLIRLATILHEKKDSESITIIIEEPEQNLHPAIQSKLAKLFYKLATKNNCKFVIETHSEYLIRNTQVIVSGMGQPSEEKLEKVNPFKVYYFPEKDVPYEMIYRNDGCFSNEFGSGFFDEASNLAFKLF